jgi:tetratricopeptide (TPR) repeat protein
VLNETGRPAQAVESAKQAVGLCRENPMVSEALFFFGQSRLRQGQLNEAEKIAAQLMEQVPAKRTGERQARYLQLRGEIALKRGDPAGAVRELEQADALLKESPPDSSRANLRMPVRFSLASAYLETKQTDNATRGLEDIVRDKRALLGWPIPYVRSFFILGKAYRHQGETSKAVKHLDVFLRYWKDGELDSDKVKEAEKCLSGF